jgi:hypothetical protein
MSLLSALLVHKCSTESDAFYETPEVRVRWLCGQLSREDTPRLRCNNLHCFLARGYTGSGRPISRNPGIFFVALNGINIPYCKCDVLLM